MADPLTMYPRLGSFVATAGNPLALCDVGHQGLFWEREFHKYNNRMRIYDPQGRFLQHDPLGYVNGMSMYECVRSCPISCLDPFGLDVWTEGSGPGEPLFHQSISIGDPNGNYFSFSFGLESRWDIFNPMSQGVVYQDYSPCSDRDGIIHTSKAEDQYFIKKFMNMLGKKDLYDSNHNCRHWTQDHYKAVKKLLNDYRKAKEEIGVRDLDDYERLWKSKRKLEQKYPPLPKPIKVWEEKTKKDPTAGSK